MLIYEFTPFSSFKRSHKVNAQQNHNETLYRSSFKALKEQFLDSLDVSSIIPSRLIIIFNASDEIEFYYTLRDNKNDYLQTMKKIDAIYNLSFVRISDILS